jgi:hypothetical protein
MNRFYYNRRRYSYETFAAPDVAKIEEEGTDDGDESSCQVDRGLTATVAHNPPSRVMQAETGAGVHQRSCDQWRSLGEN